MPQSTNLAKYPTGALDIIEAVCETRKPATLPYDGKDAKDASRKAKAARFMFYGLIRALNINQHNLAEHASKLMFRLSGDNHQYPNVLTIEFPATSHESDFYAAAAERYARETAGTPSPLDELLAGSSGGKGKKG